MNNKFIFFRHALTKIDSSKPVDQWILSEEGIQTAIKVLTSGEFDDIDIIYASTEKKAIQTAYYLSQKLEKKINADSGLNELNRGQSSFKDTQEEYEKIVSKVFSNINSSVEGWESAQNALIRFQKGIEKIDLKYNKKKILIVNHGIVLALYFSELIEIKRKH